MQFLAMRFSIGTKRHRVKVPLEQGWFPVCSGCSAEGYIDGHPGEILCAPLVAVRCHQYIIRIVRREEVVSARAELLRKDQKTPVSYEIEPGENK